MKTAMNHVLLRTLFKVVVEHESSLQSDVTMLNIIVDNIELCMQQNILNSTVFISPEKVVRRFYPFTRLNTLKSINLHIKIVSQRHKE